MEPEEVINAIPNLRRALKGRAYQSASEALDLIAPCRAARGGVEAVRGFMRARRRAQEAEPNSAEFWAAVKEAASYLED